MGKEPFERGPGVVPSKDGSLLTKLNLILVESKETVPPESPPETTVTLLSIVIPEPIMPSSSVAEPPVVSSPSDDTKVLLNRMTLQVLRQVLKKFVHLREIINR